MTLSQPTSESDASHSDPNGSLFFGTYVPEQSVHPEKMSSESPPTETSSSSERETTLLRRLTREWTEVVHQLEEVEKSVAHILSAGFAAGMVVTAVLSPYDRALFLSVRGKRPFLRYDNWTTPFQGVGQTLVSRSLSTGLYFPLEELGQQGARRFFGFRDHSTASSLVAGNFAGFVNALFLSPLAAVKYMSWGTVDDRDDRRSNVTKAALATYRRGGIPAFFTGFTATVTRDMTFGAVFALLRRQVRTFFFGSPECGSDGGLAHWKCFTADAIAAGMAAITSGPLNYARNQQFAHHSRDSHPPTISESLTYFSKNLKKRDSLYAKARYAQTRLMIGWGTLRVAAGMGLSSLCYDIISSLSDKPE